MSNNQTRDILTICGVDQFISNEKAVDNINVGDEFSILWKSEESPRGKTNTIVKYKVLEVYHNLDDEYWTDEIYAEDENGIKYLFGFSDDILWSWDYPEGEFGEYL